ncbi:MAG: cobyric acid synthase [Neomegalonema sp.]|nr:cobyric acid synthase [Neomegalonema sp.]
MARALMIQGTGSDVGKSLLVAGLCRASSRRGIAVLPFKPQNMSNNAAATHEGGEIGRAQALQALAAGAAPSVDMNPVLIKPHSDTGAQIIMQGKALGSVEAADYASLRPRLLAAIMQSFTRLKSRCELVIVEGAGSPAEVNLRARDIANMGFALPARVPVVLAGDIDRGGVIAQIIGTHAVLAPEDRAMVCGFLVNKFRGDPALFTDGYDLIAERTNWPGFGVLPWFSDAHLLPAEDAVALSRPSSASKDMFRILCPILSRIANFDDLDPLRTEPGVSVEMIAPGQPLPQGADLVILPGSKATRADLAFVRAQGWDIDLRAHVRQGGAVLGICGGYQMLGRKIADPDGVEGAPGSSEGLGLLAIDTVMGRQKRVMPVSGHALAEAAPVHGYEIHIGESDGPDRMRPLFEIEGRAEGAISSDGQIMGTYLHGMFAADGFRRAFLRRLGWGQGGGVPALGYQARIEQILDALGEHMERHLDIDAMLSLAA